MPTYAQLQAEQWWTREIVTPELAQFGAWVREHWRLSADAIGNKGNNVHLNGSHRSQEWILKSKWCTNRTYTVQAGLTAEQLRHIAGEDITPASTADMLTMSQRVDRATRAGQLEEVVAWYGNLNGDTRVDGYDNIRNVAATSDSSHLWHLHLSLDRRVLRDLNAMRRIFAVLTGTQQGVTMASVLTADEQRRLQNGDEYPYGFAGELDPLPNIHGGGGALVAVPNLPLQRAKRIEQKLDALALAPAAVLSETQMDDLAQRMFDKLAAKFGEALVSALMDPRAIEAFRQGANAAEDT